MRQISTQKMLRLSAAGRKRAIREQRIHDVATVIRPALACSKSATHAHAKKLIDVVTAQLRREQKATVSNGN